MSELFCRLYSFIWQYWLDDKDKVVKVLGVKTALIDRYGQRRKASPMIWRTIKNKWYLFKVRRKSHE